jgi:hypothetical protein
MLRLIVAIVSSGFCSLAGAQVTTLADVKAKNGVQLSAEELKQLMPGAKVVSRTQAGSTRRWENDPDGTLLHRRMAAARPRAETPMRPRPARGESRTTAGCA